MKQAIEHVKANLMGYREASRHFNVPLSTLYCFCRIRRATRNTWNAECMREAIECIRSKRMGYKKAALLYGVPRTTLYRLCQLHGPAEEIVKTKLGRPFHFTYGGIRQIKRKKFLHNGHYKRTTRKNLKRLMMIKSVVEKWAKIA
ncbi:CENP-B N-terminal DNA-binding domain [Popillia japonica]|uniref:CENP-B N-terminal DNA-binding domain n=1 Tax=Popillia japonica TaxID=7064 RepID=A0AAW1L7P8_POPJA